MNKSIKVLSVFILGVVALYSLFFKTNNFSALAEEINNTLNKAQWSYQGQEAPEYWGKLATEYNTCAIGNQQSPIDIRIQNVNDAELKEIEFAYKQTSLYIVNNGHTIEVDYAPGSFITLDGKKYNLLQFHFHDPSEHTVDGFNYPMEVHLVHQNPDGDLAVVAVFLEIGNENQVLKPLWENIPAEKGVTKTVAEEINAAELLPTISKNYYRYYGSLTTPPCSEIVNWIVMKEPIQVSSQQVKDFATLVGKNSRPTQNIGHRFVLD